MRMVQLLREKGGLTRRELEVLLDTSRPTLEKTLQELLALGLLLSREERRGRGRPATVFRLNPMARFALGVDLELPGLYFVALDLEGKVLAQHRSRINGSLDDPRDCLEEVCASLVAWTQEVGIAWDKVIGVGVGMPIFWEGDAVTVKGRNLPTWVRVPAREILEGELGVSVTVGHDVHHMALAEAEYRGMEKGELFYVALRLGLRGDIRMGACLITGGRIYKGAHGNGGSLYQAFIEPEELRGLPRQQRLERIAGSFQPHFLHAIPLLDPDTVAINAAELGEDEEELVKLLSRRVQEALRPEFAGRFRIVPAAVREAAGAIGGALAVLQHVFRDPEVLWKEVVAGEKVASGKAKGY